MCAAASSVCAPSSMCAAASSVCAPSSVCAAASSACAPSSVCAAASSACAPSSACAAPSSACAAPSSACAAASSACAAASSACAAASSACAPSSMCAEASSACAPSSACAAAFSTCAPSSACAAPSSACAAPSSMCAAASSACAPSSVCAAASSAYAPSSVCAAASSACAPSISARSSVHCVTACKTTTLYPTVIRLSNSEDTPTSSTPPQTPYTNKQITQKVLKSKPKRTTCTFCNMIVNKKNIKIHIQRRHLSANTDVNANHHLPSQCIDRNKGIFAVGRTFSGFGNPIHVQKCTWGNNHQVSCELEQCKRSSEFSRRIGLMGFQCIHVKSLSYCPISSEPDITLKEEVLSDMSIAKWHLNQTRPELFLKVICTDSDVFDTFAESGREDVHTEESLLYPPNGRALTAIVLYLLDNKKLPNVLPKDVCSPQNIESLPKHLIPLETFCTVCPGKIPLSDPILITQKAKIVTFTGILEAVTSYCKRCGVCGHFYRYQEWAEGLHNFDDHTILTLHLCLFLRQSVQVSPSYEKWAPWIGPRTRASKQVLNTEYAKLKATTSVAEQADIDITEERLSSELMNLKGSKMDLLLRLREEMKTRSTYDKVFQKVWGASGGWAVIMCPCGIVNSVKFNIRAESPRDYADMLLSFQHFPNIVIYDFARGLATHTNLREPERLPFSPYEGRVAAATPENILSARRGELKMNLPWLQLKKDPPDLNGHPATGSAEHYALYDTFHQYNTRDDKDALRVIGLVPELCGWINSQAAEQLFSGMRKNNYFMNSLSPASHIFLMRNILHHHNERVNQRTLADFKQVSHGEITLDADGKAILECPFTVPKASLQNAAFSFTSLTLCLEKLELYPPALDPLWSLGHTTEFKEGQLWTVNS
ncbi:putative HMG domain-containing protein 3-like [Triplophysa rosa]|uniref:HMG domain-containing protein 3-like n=1 Tax=Triplophysa rosa TaxID=992332 RepID=A0A9W7T2Q5_TRIRA|nr:putative HMG domain-containing protein 3-like [Triplophysa rosa]